MAGNGYGFLKLLLKAAGVGGALYTLRRGRLQRDTVTYFHSFLRRAPHRTQMPVSAADNCQYFPVML